LAELEEYETSFTQKNMDLDMVLDLLSENSIQMLIAKNKLKKIFKELDLDLAWICLNKYFAIGEKGISDTVDLYNSTKISMFLLIYSAESKQNKKDTLLDFIDSGVKNRSPELYDVSNDNISDNDLDIVYDANYDTIITILAIHFACAILPLCYLFENKMSANIDFINFYKD
jgi:hypothetical protein